MTASEGGSEQEARRLDILLRSRNREGDRGQQYQQFKSVSLVNNHNNNISNNSLTKQNNYNNNHNNNNTNKSNQDQSQENRKLSYVGLSCAVSGYSPYTAYSTELTDIPRKVTPPAQIPVANGSQVLDAVLNNYAPMVKPEYEIANNNNNNNYSSCNNVVVGDRRNETINMRQQVIHQEGHIPPTSINGRTSDNNTHTRNTNGSQNGNNRFGGGFDCTDEAQNRKCSSGSSASIITSSFYPTKTQIISGNTPTLERVTELHTSHIQQQQNANSHIAAKGNNGTVPISIIREGSPGSDDSGSASTCSSSGGNLVQKQIERLYGGKERIVPVRLTHQSSSTGSSTTTSPPPLREDRDKSFERQNNSCDSTSSGTSSNHWSKPSSYQQEEEGGFFAKRFGIVKQKEHETAGRRSDRFLGNGPFSNEHPNGESNALDFKPLKVPAVFRLLRPEFREQLKSNSCQVQIPTENGDSSSSSNTNFSYRNRFASARSASSSQSKERIVPIQQHNGGSASPPTVIATTTTCETARRERVIPIHLSSGSPSQIVNNNNNNGNNKEELEVSPIFCKQERVIPIQRENGHMQERKNINGSLAKQLNGSIDTSRPIPTSRQAAGLTTQEIEQKSASKSPLKPALPAKPTQTSPPKQTLNKQNSSTKKSSPEQQSVNKGTKLSTHVVQSPTLVANCLNKSNNTTKTNGSCTDAINSTSNQFDSITKESNTSANKKTGNNVECTDNSKLTPSSTDKHDFKKLKADTHSNNVIIEEVKNSEEEPRENNYSFHSNDAYDLCRDSSSSVPEYDDDEGMSYDDGEDNYGGGIRERSLLCPILEEDGESTASTSSLIASSLNSASSRPKYVTSVSKYNDISNENNEEEINNAIPLEDCELQKNEQIGGEVRDGHYFIRLLENEIFKFEEQICDFEELVDLNSLSNTSSGNATASASIPDDVMEEVLAGVGKAKLLMSQKMVQFRGLCDKNIAAMDPNSVPDPFVPTSGDLHGFWDMVYIQVEHIHALFAELREIRANGWQKLESKPATTEEKGTSNSTRSVGQTTKKKKPFRPTSARATAKKTVASSNGDDSNTTKDPPSTKEQTTGKKSEAAKARDEARKKMMAERKKKMLELKQKTKEGTDNKQDDNELFVVI